MSASFLLESSLNLVEDVGETICVDTVRMDDWGAGPRNGIDPRQKAVEHVWVTVVTVEDKSCEVCFEVVGRNLVTRDWMTQASRKVLQ